MAVVIFKSRRGGGANAIEFWRSQSFRLNFVSWRLGGCPHPFQLIMARRPARDYNTTMRVLIIGCDYVALPLGSELAAARIKFPQ